MLYHNTTNPLENLEKFTLQQGTPLSTTINGPFTLAFKKSPWFQFLSLNKGNWHTDQPIQFHPNDIEFISLQDADHPRKTLKIAKKIQLQYPKLFRIMTIKE
jgi:hypothetical protein